MKQLKSELECLETALKSVATAGGLVVAGGCCPECSIERAMDLGYYDAPAVAIVSGPSIKAAFPEGAAGRMRRPLFISHRGRSSLICAALEHEGLGVRWSGRDADAIQVVPATTH